MMNKIYFILLAFALFGCSKKVMEQTQSESQVDCTCMFETVFADSGETLTPDNNVVINGAEISGNCLKINLSASGCSGDSWEYVLKASQLVLDTDPSKRSILLELNNGELCEAWITKEVSFDISNLQETTSNAVELQLLNSGNTILYTY